MHEGLVMRAARGRSVLTVVLCLLLAWAGAAAAPQSRPAQAAARGASPTAAPRQAAAAKPVFVPLSPVRLLDTRGADGPALRGGETRTVKVAGRGGVPADALDVTVNVTAVSPPGSGYLTVWPSGPRPGNSTVNFPARRTVANLAETGLADDGSLQLFGSSGSPDVLLDVVGYHVPPGRVPAGSFGPGAGSVYTSLPPTRLLDTRGPGPSGGSPFVRAEQRMVQITGLAGVPVGASAVVLNLAAVAPSARGYIEAFGIGPRPYPYSSVSLTPHVTVANLVVVALPDYGSIAVYNSDGTTHVLIDVVGYYAATTVAPSGTIFSPVTPYRLVDTRSAGQGPAFIAGTSRTYLARDPAETAAGDQATSIVANLTAVAPAGSGYLEAWAGGARPYPYSSVNYQAGTTTANLAAIPLAPDGSFQIYSSSTTDVLVDVVGVHRARARYPGLGPVGSAPGRPGPGLPTAPGYIETIAGNGEEGLSGDGGPATSAATAVPQGLVVDAAGDVYFSEAFSSRVRRVTPDGTISTVAGSDDFHPASAAGDFGGDGGPATAAHLADPTGLALDAAGDLYIADTLNNRVRMVDPDGIISTVSGHGEEGGDGDAGPATSATLNHPVGLTVDPAGNLYIADSENGRVRRVAPTGTITTFAGTTCCASDFYRDSVPATQSRLFRPYSVLADHMGGVFIADTYDHTVRRVDPFGIITRVAGREPDDELYGGYAGDGGPARDAQLNLPTYLEVDHAGNLYIVDSYNGRVRRVTTDGTISTVVGPGFNSSDGMRGDGGPATSARLRTGQIAVDSAGDLYLADGGDEHGRYNGVRRVQAPAR